MINEDNEWELSDIFQRNRYHRSFLSIVRSDRYIIGHFLKIFLKKKKTRTYRDIKSNEKIDITGKLPTTILMQFLTF